MFTASIRKIPLIGTFSFGPEKPVFNCEQKSSYKNEQYEQYEVNFESIRVPFYDIMKCYLVSNCPIPTLVDKFRYFLYTQ